jgi:putative restriction endonuclease
VVTNGLALCKLHHAAFDRHIVGIRPDLVVEVRQDILDEIDGPMLRHGLQELQGTKLLVLPTRRAQHPNVEALSERYDVFRSAG